MNEITRAQKARLGLFLVISGSLLLVVLLIVTGTKFLEKRDEYHVRYSGVSVSGLEIGAQVKYHGVRVGRVEQIEIDREDVSTIIVDISLMEGTPVTEDVEATISSLSLTGLKIIELTGGSADAELVKPGSEIPAGKSDWEMITGKAEAVSEKLEMVLNNLIELTSGSNQEKFMNLVTNTTVVLEDFHDMLAENKAPIASTFANIESASKDIKAITSSVGIKRTISNLDSISSDLNRAKLAVAITKMTDTFDEAYQTFNHIDLTILQGRHDLLMSLEVLREAMESFNEFNRLISEDPSLIWRGRPTEDRRGNTGRLK